MVFNLSKYSGILQGSSVSVLDSIFMKKKQLHLPKARGLYDPNNEKENCGVGFIANLKSNSSHQITQDALEMLTRMDHRGACGCAVSYTHLRAHET